MSVRYFHHCIPSANDVSSNKHVDQTFPHTTISARKIDANDKGAQQQKENRDIEDSLEGSIPTVLPILPLRGVPYDRGPPHRRPSAFH